MWGRKEKGDRTINERTIEEVTMSKGNRGSEQINGLIDRGCSLEGKLMFDGTVQINGDFRGEVLSDGTLVVGSEAHIDATIKVDSIVIEGNVQGLVEAKSRIELRRGSRLVANIMTPALIIEEGATFHGQSHMLAEGAAVQAQPASQVPAQESVFAEEGDDSLMM